MEIVLVVTVLLLIALAGNIYVIFKNEKPVHGILWAIFVIGVPPIGTLVYILFTIIRAFMESPKIVKT